MNGIIGFDGSLSGSISDGGSGTTNYNDLSNKPSINSVPLVGNKTTSDLHLFEGDYDDLDNRPAINGITLSGNKTTADLGLFSGNYNDLTNKPTLFSGNYNDLTNKPTLFSGDYNDLTNKPTLFDGDYDSLTDRPTINNVVLTGNKNTADLGLFSGDYNDLTNKPTLFDGDYDGLTDKPEINGVTLAGNKTTADLDLFSGDYNDLTNKPTLFSGDYNDLSNKPSIPDIDMLPAGAGSQTSTKIELDNVIYNLADADARDIIGDGQLDPDFTATDLTEACNELKNNLSNLGTFYTYSWTANSSSAYGAQLTQKITLPRGNYILFGVSPVLSVTECAIALTSNNPINAPFTLNNVRTRTLLGYTFQVTQDNTDVWIMAGGSISVSYTGISDASGRIIRVG